MNHSWMNYTVSGKPSPANLLQYEDDRSLRRELHMKKLMLAAALLFGLPLAYDAAVDKASWTETQDFLAGIFNAR